MNKPTMVPVTREQFDNALVYGKVMLKHVRNDINCAFHFSTEFGDVAMMRKIGGDLTLAIITNGKPVALFVKLHDKVNGPNWARVGEEVCGDWTKSEIYDLGLKIASKLAKGVAK